MLENNVHGQAPATAAVVKDHCAGPVMVCPPRLVAVTDTRYGVLPAAPPTA